MVKNSSFLRTILAILQSTLALLILSAIVAQYLSSSTSNTFSTVTFFSYFTIEANIVSAVTLFASSYYLLSNKTESNVLQSVRGATAVYMIITGMVFNLLLRETAFADPLLVPWSAEVLHVVAPVSFLIFWILNPPKNKLSSNYIFIWFVFPIVWLLYTYLRAFVTDFYIYHFLDPKEVGGLRSVFLHCRNNHWFFYSECYPHLHHKPSQKSLYR